VDAVSDKSLDAVAPTDPAPRPSTPTVLAVLVAGDPGPSLDVVMAGLASQDHPRLETLVVDAGTPRVTTGESPLVERVGRLLPGSTIARMEGSPGFGAAVTAGLTSRTGVAPPSFLLLLADDVLLVDTAVRRMVEHALESNAGIVGAKVLAHDGSRTLDDLGASVDRLGTPVPLVEAGELDQGQYDTIREVLAVSGAVVLVRTDLFEALGGIDPEVRGADGLVELCWRARLLGATMATAPTAVARRVSTGPSPSDPSHPSDGPSARGSGSGSGSGTGESGGRRGPTREHSGSSAQRARNRLRMVLVCHRPARAVGAVVGLLAATLVGAVYGLATGRFRHAAGLVGAWPWNLRRLSSIRRRRRIMPTPEATASATVARLEVPHRAFQRVVTGRDLTGSDDRSPSQLRLHRLWSMLFGPGGMALMVSAVVLGFGSRSLVVNGLPAVGRMQPLPVDPMDLVRSWWLGWRPTGTGTTVVGPDGLALIGLLDGFWPWGSGLVWTLVVLAALPVGAVGVWRLTQPVGGGRSRAVAVLVYLSVPLPYDALRDGRLAPMVAFAVLPWVVRRLVGAQGVAPYGTRGGEAGPGTRRRGLWSEVLVTGLLLAAVAAVDPMLAVPVLMVLVGLVVGTILAGSLAGLGRLVVVTTAGVAVAGLLHLPLVLELVGGRPVGSLLNPIHWPVHGVGTMEMFRLDTGDFGLGRVGFALLVVPVLALVVARGRHLFIALRAWFVVAASWSAVWILDQGWWDGPTPDPGVLLAPAAVGLAWAAAVGVAGLGSDLLGEAVPARTHAGAGAGVGAVPATAAAGATDADPGSGLPSGRSRPSGARLRWLRRGAVGVAGLSLAVAVLPVLGGSIDGAWGTARDDLRAAVPFISTGPLDGGTIHGGIPRVLWLGDPSVLPAVGIPVGDDHLVYDLPGRSHPGGALPSGAPIPDGLAMAVTNGRPDLIDQWPIDLTEGLASIRTSVVDAMAGDTSRLGARLATWGVGWVVLVERSAPVPQPAREVSVPDLLAGAMSRQLDLERMEGINRAVTVYRSTVVEAPLAVVRDRNRRAVPVTVTREAFDRRVLTASADGSLRWAVGPEGAWRFTVDGVRQPLVASGDLGTPSAHPSVRVAMGTVGVLELDDSGSRSRRTVQVVLLGATLLLASWARTARVSRVGRAGRENRP
jgi:GT2 family glycosyltransferase